MEKKTQVEHQSQIDDLIGQLASEQDAQGPTLESIRRINRISDQLREICGCLYYEHFRPEPLSIQRPFSMEEFKEFIGKAIDSGQDYRVINEDGTSGMSGGPLGVEFEQNHWSCSVCYPTILDLV